MDRHEIWYQFGTMPHFDPLWLSDRQNFDFLKSKTADGRYRHISAIKGSTDLHEMVTHTDPLNPIGPNEMLFAGETRVC